MKHLIKKIYSKNKNVMIHLYRDDEEKYSFDGELMIYSYNTYAKRKKKYYVIKDWDERPFGDLIDVIQHMVWKNNVCYKKVLRSSDLDFDEEYNELYFEGIKRITVE